MKFRQQGSTLIIVLIFLVAITIIGTLAIRQSMVGLNIATNSQVQQLLVQNSDAAFFNVEEERNLLRSLASNGMFGFIDTPNRKDMEMVFCFRGTNTDFFNLNQASLMQWREGDTTPTNNMMGTNGYCDVEKTGNFFTSGRRVTMTQVAVKFPSSMPDTDPFFGALYNTDEEALKRLEAVKVVKVFAVSITPGISNVDRTRINVCLQQRMNEVTIPDGTTVNENAPERLSVTECLAELNIPFASHVNEYVIAQDFS